MRRRSRLLDILIASALVTASAALGITFAPPASAAVTHDTTVYAFGSAGFSGSTEPLALARPLAAIAPTADGKGYWLVAQDGSVYSFNAQFHGGLNGFPLAFPVVGMTATTTGNGYWIVTADGSVFPFGDAHWYGAMTKVHLNAPIRALIPGPNSLGYWLYAADGGVFAFGSARFHGSTGGFHLNAPVVGMASTPSGNGYWLVASDGGIFSFGDAVFRGSTASFHLRAPVVGMARDGSGKGYWLAGADGGVFTFGDAHFRGSASGIVPLDHHVIQLIGMPDGNGYRMLSVRNIPDVALVGMGAQGPAVLDVQNRLSNLGYWLPSINGVFDANMQQAVWAFQKANGLPRTGRVDGPTQAAFRSAGRARARSSSGYVIELDKARQIIMVVVNGFTRYTFNTSTGTEGTYFSEGATHIAHTPEGIFSIVSQIDGADNAPLGLLWRPKFFTYQGHAIHGSGSIPPYPASHGCARVSNAAIDWMWANNVLPLGATVWVY